jgi:hypothetical protein
MNLNMLTVFQCPFPKKRFGRNNDGGYVIAEIPKAKYTTFISGGIADDISFELDFINKYQNVTTFAFDGTINGLPDKNNSIRFINKNIGSGNNELETNIHDIIDESDSIFVKMDIEGGEIPWINSLTEHQMNKFEQIVIEFHSPFSDDEIDVFSKLNKHHILVHLHGNNHGGTRIYQGVVMPNVFECTYIHKKYFMSAPKYNTDSIPSRLDMKNSVTENEIVLNYKPFVYKPLVYNAKRKHVLSHLKFA